MVNCKKLPEKEPEFTNTLPEIVEFSGVQVDESRIKLTWETKNALNVRISTLNSVPKNGTEEILYSGNKTFELTATNYTGQIKKKIEIEFHEYLNAEIKIIKRKRKVTGSGVCVFEGVLENIGKVSAYHVEIYVLAYNKNNKLIERAFSNPSSGGYIKPGQQVIFEAYFDKLKDWDDVDHIDFSKSWKNHEFKKKIR